MLRLSDYSPEEKKADETREADWDFAIEEVENNHKSKKEKEKLELEK